MPAEHPRELQFYQKPNGREPFTEWLESRDQKTQDRIQERLTRLAGGNFGDCKPVGEGVFEMRLHFGAGYRIYFSKADSTTVLLLCGGDKSSQDRDIARAKAYWQEYKESQQ